MPGGNREGHRFRVNARLDLRHDLSSLRGAVGVNERIVLAEDSDRTIRMWSAWSPRPANQEGAGR
ncbi:hypothetical protein [Streptomyces sp. NPDC091649]|uniref:hypothetical protein n=1 Tax=Streptomyces sp. NPDC091649 TaxID=3366004 RepID=UPI00380B426C